MKSMKLGSSAGRSKPTTPTSDPNHTHPDGAAVEGERAREKQETKQKSVIPRTRDDSSDEEDRPSDRRQGPLLDAAPPYMGHAPILPLPGNYPPLHPPHHMMPMRGGPEPFYGHGRGIVGPMPMPPPPRSMGGPGAGILGHPMPPPSMVSWKKNDVMPRQYNHIEEVPHTLNTG